MAMETKKPKPAPRANAKYSFRKGWSRYGWPVVRHLIIPVVCVLVLFAGMAVGYVVLGDKPYSDIWQVETWRHMFDLIFAES